MRICITTFILFILITYYMILSFIFINIHNHRGFYIIDYKYHDVSYTIIFTSPFLLVLFFYNLSVDYIKNINNQLIIRELLETKKYLIKENAFLKKRTEIPVHLKIICVKHFIGEEEYKCPICLEEMKENTITIKCDHKYHQDCIKTWFDTGKLKCPLCQESVV